MWKKTLLTGCLILLLIVGSPLLTANRPGETSVNVMVLSGTTGLSLVKLLEEQPPIAPDVTFNYTVIKSPDQMSAKIISGEADIAAVPTNLASILYNRGIPVQLAAITNWGVMYVVGRDTTIATWADLKGKEIGVTGKGSTPDLLFRYFLEANGLDPETDVQIGTTPARPSWHNWSLPTKFNWPPCPSRGSRKPFPQSSPVGAVGLPRRVGTFGKTGVSYPKVHWWSRPHSPKSSRPSSVLLKRQPTPALGVVDNPDAPVFCREIPLHFGGRGHSRHSRCHLRFNETAQVQPEIEHFLAKLYSFQPQAIGGKLPDEGFYLQK